MRVILKKNMLKMFLIMKTMMSNIMRKFCHLKIKTSYWVIIYLCVARFHLPSESLIFAPNPGHFTPKSP